MSDLGDQFRETRERKRKARLTWPMCICGTKNPPLSKCRRCGRNADGSFTPAETKWRRRLAGCRRWPLNERALPFLRRAERKKVSGPTSIAWTDVTWNPVRGCSRVSKGCENCYAERIAARFSGPGMPYEHFAYVNDSGESSRRHHWTGRVEMVESALDWPLRWRGSKRALEEGRPSRIFVNSMSDLFHEKLSDEDIDRVFAVMALAKQHTFQVLTKRAERMRTYMEKRDWSDALNAATNLFVRRLDGPLHLAGEIVPPLPNVWLGVSVEEQATADERIPLLLQTPAAVRFVSYEPALGPVDFSAHGGLHCEGATGLIDWMIVGGESGPDARPFDLAWARAVIEQCREAGVACFVKQIGARPTGQWRKGGDKEARIPGMGRLPMTEHPFMADGHWWIRNRKGGDPSEWPGDLRVREFPKDAR